MVVMSIFSLKFAERHGAQQHKASSASYVALISSTASFRIGSPEVTTFLAVTCAVIRMNLTWFVNIESASPPINELYTTTLPLFSDWSTARVASCCKVLSYTAVAVLRTASVPLYQFSESDAESQTDMSPLMGHV